mgnify:CR=1 FL=1
MFRQTSAETLVIKDYSNFRSYSSAAISMVVVCHIQAGVPAIVKWEEGHAVMVDLHTVRAISQGPRQSASGICSPGLSYSHRWHSWW